MRGGLSMQPFTRDAHGVVRFRENALVRYLLDNGGIDLNQLARVPASQADREQLMQLIGYSLAGFHELSFVSDEVAFAASHAAAGQGFEASGCRDEGCEIHCGVGVEQGHAHNDR